MSTQESKPENDQGDCSRRSERSMTKRSNPATAHTQSPKRGAQTTSRSSALVRGRSAQFIANPCRWPQRPCPETGLHFCHVPAVTRISAYWKTELGCTDWIFRECKMRIERIRGSRLDTDSEVWGLDQATWELMWAGEAAMRKIIPTLRQAGYESISDLPRVQKSYRG